MKNLKDHITEASLLKLKYDFNLSQWYKPTSKRNFLFVNFNANRISFIDIDNTKEVESWAYEFGDVIGIEKHLDKIRGLKVGEHTTFDNATYYVRIK
jgi:hypothetical protein